MAPRGSTSKRKVESDSDSDVEIVAVKKAPAATRKSKVTKRESSSDPDIKPVLQKPPAKRPKIEDEDLLEDRKPFDDEPETADGALDGLTLIFTGDLKIHKRDAATKLAERLGAKVLTTPAPTITHAVVGENAAPAKVKKLQKDQIRVLHEAEWLELLKQGRASPLYSPLCWKPGISKMGPVAPGNLEIPVGEADCLAGLTLVFTGELTSIGRDEAINLAKRYGARVTGAPSSKTDYVVVGSAAGPSKLKKIEDLGLKTVDEGGFLDLIRTRKADETDDKFIKKKADEEKKIKQAAKEMGKVNTPERKAQLWTVKYAPREQKEICGNKGSVEKLITWLNDWPKFVKAHFKKPGKDLMGTYRAVLISGPPGIGKTTAAHLAASIAGYSAIELNASDTRSKKLLELGLKSAVDNTSLDGFFQTGTKSDRLFEGQPGKGAKPACLIMDEVDGMSGGDRGGVGALNILIKRTKIPIICIANDASLPKMKPLANTTLSMKFKRPSAQELRARLMTIAYKEKIKISAAVVDQLVEGAQSDMRSIINMMSTYALTAKDDMDFDTGRKLAADSEKNSLMTPFVLIDKLFGPYTFSATNKQTLNDKLDYYFHDFGAMPLFVHENYAKFNFSRTGSLFGRDKDLKRLELVERASASISDGDVLDSVIHGSEQHWSLLPAHGIASTVRPAYFCYGSGNFGGGAGGYSSGASTRAFPAWFGKNSSGTRLRTALGNVQIHMRLAVSGDRKEIRQSYLPVLAQKLAIPLAEQGADGIEQVMALMDDYFLTKEEYDTVMEMGLGESNGEALLKGVDSKVKAALTRAYTKASHPIAFHRGVDLGKAAKKMPKGERPDIDDIIELDEEAPEDDEPEKEDDGDAVTKDKLLKNLKKPKKEPANGESGKAAAKKPRAPAKKK